MSIENIRHAISIKNRDERLKVAIELHVLDKVFEHWNGGKICGQCKHFNPIKLGMNGTCSKVPKHEYTKPEDLACNHFERGGE